MGKAKMDMAICGNMITMLVWLPLGLAINTPKISDAAIITAASPHSSLNSRQTIRLSSISSPIRVSVHNTMDDPNGWPLNISSQRPRGKPSQAGQIFRWSMRQPSSSNRPHGGIAGDEETMGSSGIIDATIVEAMGMPCRCSGDGALPMRERGWRATISPLAQVPQAGQGGEAEEGEDIPVPQSQNQALRDWRAGGRC